MTYFYNGEGFEAQGDYEAGFNAFRPYWEAFKRKTLAEAVEEAKARGEHSLEIRVLKMQFVF